MSERDELYAALQELVILRRIVTEWDSARGDELVADVRARITRLHSRLIRKALKDHD